jgi:hypothetical protein
LLEAAMNLEVRIRPLFAKLEDERKEKEVLNKKVAERTQKLKAHDVEVKKLREELRDAREHYERLAPVADQAKDRWIREKAENVKLLKTVKRQKELLEVKDEENRELQSSLEERKKQVCNSPMREPIIH